MSEIKPPPKRPCGSCPYRRDVPSGVWDASEYEKLPRYDLPTVEQPHGVFLCHQLDGCVCAGWAAVSANDDTLALRFAVIDGRLDYATIEKILDYTTDVPLFSTGTEAAERGLRDIAAPSGEARRTMAKLERRRAVCS